MPKLTVVTINYNNLAGLQRTMESVFSQNYRDFEFIIIDGASTDGSGEYISQHSDKLGYWVSEKDSGIYDAMNKGISRAGGEYLLFLNSGDHFFSATSLGDLFSNSSTEDIIYGDMLIKEEDGKEWIYNYPDNLSFGYFYKSSLPHQASIIRKVLLEKAGLYNVQLKIAADWEFFINAVCIHNCTYKHVPAVIAVFYTGGISTRPAFKELTESERTGVLQKGYSAYLKEYKDYFDIQTELSLNKKSRLHRFVKKLTQSALYKNIKS